MKKKTTQLLLSSFNQSGSDREIGLRSYQFYYDIFSDLSEGGVRSSVFQLVEKGFLKRLTLNGQSFFNITDAGISKLGLLLPGLRIKERKKGDTKGWLIILVNAPKQDPHFLKLHQIIKKHLCKQFVRGVYFYPFSAFPESLFDILLTRYSSSLTLVEVKDFSLVSPDQEKNQINFKKKLSNILSRISSASSSLINSKNDKNKLIYQCKNLILSSFEFIYSVLESDEVVMLEDKVSRGLFFQIIMEWNNLIYSVYFSQR